MGKRKRPIEDERVEAQKFSDSLDSLSETLSETRVDKYKIHVF